MSSRRRRPSLPILITSLVGIGSFLYPFFLPLISEPETLAGRGVEVPILFAGLSGICLLAILLEVQGNTAGSGGPSASKMVALLGVLVAIDATLRLIPSLLGASPIYLLIILVGFAYGADFGFLMGALTLLVSAFITGGLGPWLPFQMLTAGWLGMSAGWLPRSGDRRELALLVVFSGVWGFLFGAIMNLWSWPFAAPGLQETVGLYWVPGMTLGQTIETYARFYLVTSLVYDLLRAIGNVLLVLLLARPVVALLDRYRERFSWEPWTPLDEPGEPEPAS